MPRVDLDEHELVLIAESVEKTAAASDASLGLVLRLSLIHQKMREAQVQMRERDVRAIQQEYEL